MRFWIVILAFAVLVFSIWIYAVGCTWRQELNTLFSGLALVAIAGTLIFQGREIKQSQDALKTQNEVMNKAALLQGYTTWLKYQMEQEQTHVDDISQFLREDHAGHARHAAKRIHDLLLDIEASMKQDNRK